MGHAQMLKKRRAKQRNKKVLAGIAKREKKAGNQTAKAAGAKAEQKAGA
ncbi:MAG: hypothetical protein IH605_01480 [Burkholderiales bacterium]|nr:hypothetical protein [Burkholderiales bacterium]